MKHTPDSDQAPDRTVFARACRLPLPSAPLLLAALCAWLAFAGSAEAVPSFARQTQLQCTACHTAYPQLNAFGRRFKLNGYTLQPGDVSVIQRFSAMAQPSFTHTNKDQPADPAEHFGNNDNLALTQASVFYGGRLIDDYDKLGGFVQVTYDGIERSLAWDLADFRWATSDTLAGKPVTWGIDLNNTPTVQDVWNTTPAWGYPFSGSGLAPGPAAATLISDPLGGTVLGLGGYVYWNDSIYGEFNLYKTVGGDFLRAMGVQGVDQEIDGVAPYWRLALDQQLGGGDLELGTFGLYARTYPGRDHTAGTTDRYLDLGLDMQYQRTLDKQYITARAAWIHEDQTLRASTVLGGADNRDNHLNTLALSLSDLYDHTYGVTLGYNHIGGSSDAALYGGSPDSDYFTVELDWLPLNKHAGVAGSHGTFDPRLSLQYTAYSKLDGVSHNASDNNTLYLEGWLAF